jgi:hypothetical protein
VSVRVSLLVLSSQYKVNNKLEIVGTMSDVSPEDLSKVLEHFALVGSLHRRDPVYIGRMPLNLEGIHVEGEEGPWYSEVEDAKSHKDAGGRRGKWSYSDNRYRAISLPG